MKLLPFSFCRSFFYGFALAATVVSSPVLASDAKKEPPKVEEKEIKYVNEGGVEGRGGIVYKRVEKEK